LSGTPLLAIVSAIIRWPGLRQLDRSVTRLRDMSAKRQERDRGGRKQDNAELGHQGGLS
jgi:hypothetical protein